MAFSGNGAAAGSTPMPWWVSSRGFKPGDAGNAQILSNLQQGAPAGYQYDAAQSKYVRTPQSLAADFATMFSGLNSATSGGSSSIAPADTFGGGQAGGFRGGTPLPPTQLAATPGASTPGTVGAATVRGVSGDPAPVSQMISSNPNEGAPAMKTISSSPAAAPAAVPSTATGTATGTAPGQKFTPDNVLQPVDQQAGNAAAFAAAKDQVGQQMRGALTGLSGAMAGRGISGSGLEAAGQVGTIGTGQSQLGDVSRQQAVTNADLSNQNAVTSYQGNIAQEGQQNQLAEANAANAVTERGQDIGVNEANQNSLNTQRAQDLAQQENALNNATSNYSTNVGATTAERGQTLQAQQAAAALAQQKQMQLANVLQGLSY